MATKLIALNSNKFLWQSCGPCDCPPSRPFWPWMVRPRLVSLGGSRIYRVEEFACFFFTKENFVPVFSNQLSGSQFNRWQFPSFCVDLMDGLATLDASSSHFPRTLTF